MTSQVGTRISPIQKPYDRDQFSEFKFQAKNILGFTADAILSPFITPKDCIIISGFWRSGTTWLQQSIGEVTHTKIVFEPFRPQIVSYQHQVLAYTAYPDDPEFGRAFMPYWGAEASVESQLDRYIKKSIKANLANPRVRTVRTHPSQTLRTRTVVKLVRGQFCLEGISKTFKCPIIHLYRDPRAVIASIKRMHQGSIYRFLSRVTLRQLLLDPNDQRRDYFSPWEDFILEADGKDFVTKLAVLWTMTENYVQQSMGIIEPGCRIKYEDLCFGKTLNLSEFLATVGFSLQGKDTQALMSPIASRMTTKDRATASIKERISSWEKDLTAEEVRSIETIVSRFGLEESLLIDSSSTTMAN